MIKINQGDLEYIIRKEKSKGTLFDIQHNQLTKLDFAGLDLHGNFKYCLFNDVSFSNANLENGFHHCVFMDCDFKNARVWNTYFASCDFISCNFLNAVIYGPEFNNCAFNNTKFYEDDKKNIFFTYRKQEEDLFIKYESTIFEKVENIIKAEQEIDYTPIGEVDIKYTIIYNERYYSYYDYDNLFPGQWGNYLISYKIDQYDRKIITGITKYEGGLK